MTPAPDEKPSDIVWCVCPDCGHEQPDMGVGIACEECGGGPVCPR
jgi:hypothetical protein